MSEANKKLIYSTVMIAITGFMLALSMVTFAWMTSNRKNDGDGLDMSIDDGVCPDITVYTYYTQGEADATEGVDGPGWVASDVSDESSGFNHVVDNYNIHNTSFVLPSLPLGTIDNLVRPNDDNVMYIRFAVTPQNAGDKFNLTINNMLSETKNGVTTYPFELYNEDGTKIDNAEVYSKIKAKIEDGDKVLELFSLQYAITGNVEPSGLKSTVFTDVVGSSLSYTAVNTDTYYLYVKIQPNSKTFANVVRYVYAYMPCVLLYDFNIEYNIELNEE